MNACCKVCFLCYIAYLLSQVMISISNVWHDYPLLAVVILSSVALKRYEIFW